MGVFRWGMPIGTHHMMGPTYRRWVDPMGLIAHPIVLPQPAGGVPMGCLPIFLFCLKEKNRQEGGKPHIDGGVPMGCLQMLQGRVQMGLLPLLQAPIKRVQCQEGRGAFLEVNASDERNGTHIKQKFGEAVDSHAIELWPRNSIEDAVDSRRKQDLLFMMGSSFSTLRREFNNGDLKEDVDAVVDEDRGFINTIMQLAETSRRPIILTTNSKNPTLPQALSRLVVDFTRPSTAELLAHMLMVCAAEGAQISPCLVERLIRTCQGDIRKTLLLLQFWCRGQTVQQGEKIQCTYSPLLFDLDAAHQVVTKITPWAIPCELALKVEEEIAKAISIAGNQVILHQLKEEDDSVEPTYALHVSKDRTAGSPAMGKNPCPIFQHAEFLSPSKDHDDFSDDSSSPLTFTRRRLKHKTDTVLSSESGDVLATDTSIHIGSPIANSIPPGACDLQSSHPNDHLHCLNPFDESFAEHVNLSRDPFMTAEIASTSHVCDSYMSRCMHEVSLVPETEISNRQGHQSPTSSHFSASLHDFLISNVGSMQALSQEEVNNVNGTILATCKDPYKEGANMHEIYTESVHGNEEVGLSEKEAGVDLSRGYQLMDECSRAGFGIEFVPLDSFKRHAVGGSVEETWRKLRNCHEDLKSHVTPGQRDAIKILDLTSGLTDLISEADILLRSCLSLTNDILEPSAFSFDEPCSSSWRDEHLVIASTLAQHGLCFYANKAAIKQSNLGYEVPVFLSLEMLAASISSMAFGKLLSQKKTIIDNLHTERGFHVESSKCEIPTGRELEFTLFDVVHPLIPARLRMVLKGPAFHEYVSFLSCMSKSENLRLSENKDQFQQRHRRVRASRHYLRSPPFALSPEDVELLAGCSCFGQVGFR
ncbi:hypothetical protein Taro_018826 [Colocasia esculenta]|uniref:Uncharacterized protein n=1 Tax=Colocasia esculenta TaxID=4460 RepID=A0A843UUT0_COLES|nr:hypothetical protein [Colocasia esculenta]